MKIEYIAGVRLPAGRTFQQQAQRPVRHRVLGKIVIDDEDVPSFLHKILAQSGSRIGRNILQGR